MVSPLLRPVALLAGWSSLVQSVVWWILSLLGILAYTGAIEKSANVVTIDDILPAALYYIYFKDRWPIDYCGLDKVRTRDDVVTIVGVYFAVSFIWSAAAVILIINIYKREWKYTRNILWVWAVITGCVCVLDLSTCITFGIDYNTIGYDSDLNCLLYLQAPAFMMSFAARGYVLWILNLAAAIYLAWTANNLHPDELKSSQGSSIIGETYADPMDSIGHRNMGYQTTEYATPVRQALYGDSTWSIQSPHVGSNIRDNPWSFPSTHRQQSQDYSPSTQDYQPSSQVEQPPAWKYENHQTPRGYPPPSRDRQVPKGIPVRNPEVPPKYGPSPSYIPDPDYDELDDNETNPSRQRKKYEPRPFDEIPRRSALKKHQSNKHMGRTVF